MNRLCICLLLFCALAQGAIIGQIDDFEDGTTQNWVVGLLGAPHPAPPENVATGGPAGTDDNYLQLSAVGGGGPGSRLAAINLVQWAGDYTGAGIGLISMDLINLGQTELSIRLVLENPMGAPPTDVAITDAFVLPVGAGWMHATFNVTAGGLLNLLGDTGTLLSNVTALRIVHAAAVAFPGGVIVGQLGVDNITAAEIPEPGSWLLIAGGLAGLALGRKRSAK